MPYLVIFKTLAITHIMLNPIRLRKSDVQNFIVLFTGIITLINFFWQAKRPPLKISVFIKYKENWK